ncbi:MAG: hypothetical protein Q8Q07_01620 [Dehalococcoidales bacterium]|nr:hypothetical protein [Dehalococcoidales bacterium]
MPVAKQIGMEWQRREILFAWIAWQKEVGDSPEANETMERVVARKADLHLDHMLESHPLNSTDPVTVCRHVADYLTANNYAEFQIGRVADDIIYRDWKNCVEMPLIPWARDKMGLKVTPNPSASMLQAALRRFCNMKAVNIPPSELPPEVKALTPEGWVGQPWQEDKWQRVYYRLTPLK